MTLLPGILLLSLGTTVSGPVSEWPSAGFVAEKSRHGISIRGHLLSDRARDTLLATVSATGITVNSTEYSRHIVLPEWWFATAQAIVPAANLMQAGEIRLSRTALSIRGAVLADERWTEALAAVRAALPDGIGISNQLIDVSAAQKAEVCNELFSGISREPMLFRRTSWSPKTGDYRRLDRLAATLRHCPDIAIRIVGHSDAYGIASRNQLVSVRRAETVAKYLIERGVADSQLTWEGRGDREPAATNSTWEGRNLNRRVTIDRLN